MAAVACQRIGEHPKSGNKFLSPDRVGVSHLASLHAVVLVLSMYLISPGLRPICHAAVMQFRCIVSAIRPGGYARAVQIGCSHSAGRLIRLVQLGAFAAGRRTNACGSPGVWRLAAFCSARPDRPLTRLAAAMPPGVIGLARLAFALHWSPADGAIRPSSDGITATRDLSLPQPEWRQQERGNTRNRTRPARPHRGRGCALIAETPAVIPDRRHFS